MSNVRLVEVTTPGPQGGKGLQGEPGSGSGPKFVARISSPFDMGDMNNGGLNYVTLNFDEVLQNDLGLEVVFPYGPEYPVLIGMPAGMYHIRLVVEWPDPDVPTETYVARNLYIYDNEADQSPSQTRLLNSWYGPMGAECDFELPADDALYFDLYLSSSWEDVYTVLGATVVVERIGDAVSGVPGIVPFSLSDLADVNVDFLGDVLVRSGGGVNSWRSGDAVPWFRVSSSVANTDDAIQEATFSGQNGPIQVVPGGVFTLPRGMWLMVVDVFSLTSDGNSFPGPVPGSVELRLQGVEEYNVMRNRLFPDVASQRTYVFQVSSDPKVMVVELKTTASAEQFFISIFGFKLAGVN